VPTLEVARVLLVCNIRARSRVGMGFAWGATFVPTRDAPKVGTSIACVATCVPVCKLAWVLHGENWGLQVCKLMLDPQTTSTTQGTTQDKTQENKSLKSVDTINKGDIIGSTTTQTGSNTRC